MEERGMREQRPSEAKTVADESEKGQSSSRKNETVDPEESQRPAKYQRTAETEDVDGDIEIDGNMDPGKWDSFYRKQAVPSAQLPQSDETGKEGERSTGAASSTSKQSPDVGKRRRLDELGRDYSLGEVIEEAQQAAEEAKNNTAWERYTRRRELSPKPLEDVSRDYGRLTSQSRTHWMGNRGTSTRNQKGHVQDN